MRGGCMSREQVPAEGWMRPAAIAPQGDSDPLRAKARVGSYASGHRHGPVENAMVIDEVAA